MKNKLFLMSLATVVTVPALVASVPLDAKAAQVVKTFKDVSKNSPYYDIIHEMAKQGIISGYEDGRFGPNETISRKHAAVLITRAVKDLPKGTTFKQPKDLSTANAYYGDIKKLMEAGLLQLDAKGNINPNAPLTRGEMARILATAYELNTTGSHPLKDVTSTYSKYVTALYNAEVTTGFEDKTFRENEGLTRAHYAVFMYRAQEFEDNKIVLKDLEKMSDSEVLALTDQQLAQLILPFKHDKPVLPKGVTDAQKHTEQNLKKFNQISVQLGSNIFGSKRMLKGNEYSLSILVGGWSENFFYLSPKEVIELINKVYSEGIVISSLDMETKKPVVIFYDYVTGDMKISRTNE